MSVTPTLYRDPSTGEVYAVTGADLADANAVPVEIDGELWAVTLDELEEGWQDWSAVEVAQRVAGMPVVP